MREQLRLVASHLPEIALGALNVSTSFLVFPFDPLHQVPVNQP